MQKSWHNVDRERDHGARRETAMEHHKGSCLVPGQGDAPHREGEPSRHRVLQHHSTLLDRGAGRLARLVLVGCLFVILAGGALLLQPPAAQAATRGPTLGHPLAPMVALHPKGDDDDDDGGCSVHSRSCSVMPPSCSFGCSVVQPPCSFGCSVVQPPCSFNCSVVQPVCTPVVEVVQVPVIKTVTIIRDGVVCVVKVVVPVTVKKIVLVCG